MPGRSGRGADRGYHGSRAPRYLSVAPPILPFTSSSPLKGNKYEILSQDNYPNLQNLKLNSSTSIRSYSQSAKEFIESLRGDSTKNTSPTCVSDQFNMEKSCNERCSKKLLSLCRSHYHNYTDINDSSWAIFTTRKSKHKLQQAKSTRKQLFKKSLVSPTTVNTHNPLSWLTCGPQHHKLHNHEKQSTRASSVPPIMVSSPPRSRVTRSQTKKPTKAKASKPGAQPHNDTLPVDTLITHESSPSAINKIPVHDLRRFTHWWNSKQGSPITTSTIEKMQLSLLQNECHKAASIMKARFNAKKKT